MKSWWDNLTPFVKWIIRTLVMLIVFVPVILLVLPRQTPTATKVTLLISVIIISAILGRGSKKVFGSILDHATQPLSLDDPELEGSLSTMPKHNAPYMPAILDYWSTLSLPGDDFTVIDVETTGLDPEINDFVELGAIRYRHRKPVDEYHTYVRPLGCIGQEAEEKHHITWEDVADAPLFSDVCSDFLDFLGDDLILGFYVSYDIKFLQTRSGKRIENTTFDVWRLAKFAVYSSDFKLDTLRKKYGLSGIPHTALGDCESTAELYFRILKDPVAKSEVAYRKGLAPERRIQIAR